MNPLHTLSGWLVPRVLRATTCALLAAAGAQTAHGQCTPGELDKLIASDAGPNAFFGRSISASGDTMVVGAHGAEAAYVFVRTGGSWTQQAKLTPSDSGGFFGWSVAISGETIVVGAYLNAHDNLTGAGAAYVFVRSGTVWTQQAKLIPLDPGHDDNFGLSVAVSGDTVVVGAEFAEDPDGGSEEDEGAAYAFVRTGTTWTQQARFDTMDVFISDRFGSAVALGGNTAIVGSRGGGVNNTGAAYVYVRSGEEWTLQTELSPSDAPPGVGQFSYAIAIAGDTAVIGWPYDDRPSGTTDSGAAYIFSRVGDTWAQSAKLVADFPASLEYFGTSVAIAGNTVLIGTPRDGLPGIAGAGSAYLFIRAGCVWVQQAKLTASDPSANDNLGESVALAGDMALVGSYVDDHAAGVNAGSAYVFELGCDDDGDGVQNVGDACPDTPPGTPVDADGRPRADLDHDCDIDLADFSIFAASFTG